MPRYKLVFFVPRTSTQPVLQHLFARFPDHVGRIGAYAGCAFVAPGTGQFIPQEGATPAIGSVGKAERVEEDRVEILVLGPRPHSQPHTSELGPTAAGAGAEGDADAGGVEVSAVVQELKKVHPYEKVAYDVYRLEDV